MIGLFCSTSLLSEVTGGGKVSIHEFNALKEVCEEIDYFHRGSIAGDHPLDALVASVISREYDLAYLNGGPWGETVRKVKSLNPDAKIATGVPAHNIELSIEAHTNLGIDYGKFYPHMVDPIKLLENVRHNTESDLVVYSSNQAKEYFAKRFNMTNEGIVIYHGCDIPKEVPSLPEGFDVGYIGAWGPDKGVKYLIDAWNQLNYDDSTLRFFGSGSKQNRQWLESVATAGCYHLYGKYDDLPEIMPKFHLGVFPTVTEGFNLGALECMAYGKPVVVTMGAGVREIVENGVEGRVLPIMDSAGIAEAIDFYKRNPQEVVRHGVAAREKAKKYSWQEIERQYQDKFKELLEK